MPSDSRIDNRPGPSATIELDATHPTLDHHRPGGLALFGTCMSIDALAGAARRLGLSQATCALSDIEMFKPPILADDTHHKLLARFGAGKARVGEIVSPATKNAGEVAHLRARLAGMRTDTAVSAGAAAGAIVPARDVYRPFFHGPAFQVIAWAQRAHNGMLSELADHAETGFVPPVARLVEFGLQTAGLLELASSGRMMIPSSIASVVAGEMNDLSHFPVRAAARFAGAACDIDVTDANGTVLIAIRGYRTSPLPFPRDAAAAIRLKTLLNQGAGEGAPRL